MLNRITKLLIREMRITADKLEAGNSHLTAEEAMDILSCIAHESMSKEEACEYLNVSRATFDNHIRDGFLPKGRKLKGRKELIWYKDELSNVINR